MQTPSLSKFADFDYLCWIAEGKDRLIDRLPSLDDSQKSEMKRFFARNPSLERKLNWNKPDSITYDAFRELADQYPDPIDPDTVAEFSDKRDEGDGIFSYGVADTREGQDAVRRTVDTHWGRDANPWCLVARRKPDDPTEKFNNWAIGKYDPDEIMEIGQDKLFPEYERETGEKAVSPDIMDNAWKQWRHYSARPKRIAFKDGKLLAFGATDYRHENKVVGLAKLIMALHPSYKREFMRFHDSHNLPRRGMWTQFVKWARRSHPECKANMPEEWWNRKDDPFPDLDWARPRRTANPR